MRKNPALYVLTKNLQDFPTVSLKYLSKHAGLFRANLLSFPTVYFPLMCVFKTAYADDDDDAKARERDPTLNIVLGCVRNNLLPPFGIKWCTLLSYHHRLVY